MQYYIKRQNKVLGPFSKSQIESGLKSSKLKTTDLLSTSPNGPWQQISDSDGGLGATNPIQVVETNNQIHSDADAFFGVNQIPSGTLTDWNSALPSNTSNAPVASDYWHKAANTLVNRSANPSKTEDIKEEKKSLPNKSTLIVITSGIAILLAIVGLTILFGPGIIKSIKESSEFASASNPFIRYSQLEAIHFDYDATTAALLFKNFDENNAFDGQRKGNNDAINIIYEIERLTSQWPSDKQERFRAYIRSLARSGEVSNTALWMIDDSGGNDPKFHRKQRIEKHQDNLRSLPG